MECVYVAWNGRWRHKIGCMEIGCDGVIIRLKTNIGNGYIRSYDARMVICFGLRMQMSQRMMLHQGNMLRFTDAHVSSG